MSAKTEATADGRLTWSTKIRNEGEKLARLTTQTGKYAYQRFLCV